jgi:hypothetical protein
LLGNIRQLIAYFIPRKKRERQNEVIVEIRHNEPMGKLTDLLAWCKEHHCYPFYIKDEVKAKMSQRISIQCPTRSLQLLAKLRWGGK